MYRKEKALLKIGKKIKQAVEKGIWQLRREIGGDLGFRLG